MSLSEIAKLVGETEFSVLFHQGKKDHIHMSLVGDRSIMVVIFDDRTTIGMVRLYAKEITIELVKIFDDILKLPTLKSTQELFQNSTGIPDIYQESFVKSVKQWKELYTKLYGPWSDSMLGLSEKIAAISHADAGPEAYKDFYKNWVEVHEKFSGNHLGSMQPSKEAFENFVQNTEIYLNMYRSWIEALEKIGVKVVLFEYARSFRDICVQFIKLGDLVGCKEKAEANAAAWLRRQERGRRRPSVVHEVCWPKSVQ